MTLKEEIEDSCSVTSPEGRWSCQCLCLQRYNNALNEFYQTPFGHKWHEPDRSKMLVFSVSPYGVGCYSTHENIDFVSTWFFGHCMDIAINFRYSIQNSGCEKESECKHDIRCNWPCNRHSILKDGVVIFDDLRINRNQAACMIIEHITKERK